MRMSSNRNVQTQKSTLVPPPPAMGERRARLGYGAQDRLAAEVILDALRMPQFESVRLADLEGGQVDDFVLVFQDEVQGNSVKWTGTSEPLGWADFCGSSSDALLPQLAQGWRTLQQRWPGRSVKVYLRTNRVASSDPKGSKLVSGISLARFLSDDWEEFRRSGYRQESGSPSGRAWELLQQSSGLAQDEFDEFARSGCRVLSGLSLPYHGAPGSRDSEQWQHEFDRLRQSINDWVEKNPTLSDFPAQDIRRVLNLLPYQARTIQCFPEPEIGYVENEASAADLHELLKQHECGYVALLGPAGAGKSTLAQKIIQAEPFGIPYFAYLPAGEGDPRERGDALAFYRNLITVLDQWEPDVRKAHALTDLAQAREAFSLHMARIRERYRNNGHRTIILVDGLDHVTREEKMDRPLQLELPLPEELVEGCLVFISTQPQAIRKLRPQIQGQLRKPGRTVQISPLSPEAIHHCLSPKRIGRTLDEAEERMIYTSCQGNPLILTYVVKALRGAPHSSVGDTLENLGEYTGEADGYYAERFGPLLDNPDTKQLLALLCRIWGRASVTWLQSWPEWPNFEKTYQLHLAAFFHSEEGRLSFVHNSLVTYLRRETLPSVPGSDHVAADRAYYLALARRCTAGSSTASLARDRVYYQVMAEEHEAVLETATIEWFRKGAAAFIPPDEMISLLQVCYRSAVATEDHGALLQLIASSQEISQRDSVVSGSDLALKFLKLGLPERALEQAIDGNRLRVDPTEAVALSQKFARYAEETNDEDLMRKASHLFNLAKPVKLMYGEPIEAHLAHQYKDIVKHWAGAAAYFCPVEQTLSIISRLESTNVRFGSGYTTAEIRSSLLSELLDGILERGVLDEAQLVIAAMQTVGIDGLLLQAKLNYIKAAQRIGGMATSSVTELLRLHPDSSLDPVSRLRLAECLWTAGQDEDAKRVIGPIDCPAPEPYPDIGGSSPLGSPWARVRLARLRAVLRMSPQEVPRPTRQDYEGAARVATACARLGELWGTAERGEVPTDLATMMDYLLTYHMRRISYEVSWRYAHDALTAKKTVFSALLVATQALGPEGVAALREAFLRACAGPVPLRPEPYNRRIIAVGLYRLGAITAAESKDIILGEISDAKDTDVQVRTDACFEVAEALHSLGDDLGAEEWVLLAGRAAHGVGNHKDYQMATWMEWLDRSLSLGPDAIRCSTTQLAAQALEVEGGRAGNDARKHLIRACFRRDPLAGAQLALEMIERGQVSLGTALNALLHSGSECGATPSLLSAVYARLYTLVEPHPETDLGEHIVLSAGTNAQAEEVAKACVTTVRVNCPSERRFGLVRNIGDGLLRRGLSVPIWYTAGLPPSHDDNVSSSWLYRMSDGTVHSLRSIAEALSDPKREAEWNPNPSENTSLAWDEVIDMVTIVGSDHLKMLEGQFVRGDRRDAEVLAALARAALRAGARFAAESLAARAWELAHDGGWFPWLDGAVKRNALQALITLDPDRWVKLARREFETDLLQRRLNSYFLLSEVAPIFDLLRWGWPQETGLQVLEIYLRGLTAGVAQPTEYASLSSVKKGWNADEAICWFLIEQYASPVSAFAAAARQASADYLISGGGGLLVPFQEISDEDTITLERALAVLDVGALSTPSTVAPFHYFVVALDGSPSLVVRSVARRVCNRLGWQPPLEPPHGLPLIYLLSLPPEDKEIRDLLSQGAEEIPGTGIGITLELYDWMLRGATRKSGLEYQNIVASARRHYQAVEHTFRWNQARVERWINALGVLSYSRPRALVGREAAMRTLNELVQAGRLGQDTLDDYDFFAPVYDSSLELEQPTERPDSICGIKVEKYSSKLKAWVNTFSAGDLLELPQQIGEQIVIAERSLFRRPEWDWPCEKRMAGPVPNVIRLEELESWEDIVPNARIPTRAAYAECPAQIDLRTIVIRQHGWEQTTDANGWLALNPRIGNELGWHLSDTGLFRWVDQCGITMVESLWWRDGWHMIKPPRASCVVGNGWLVVCSPVAFEMLREYMGLYRMVIGGERGCKIGHDSSERVTKIEFTERSL